MKTIDAKRFVEVWQSSKTGKEAAKRLNKTPLYCYVRAANLRAAGVELKKFSPGRRSSVDALNEAARKAAL